MTCDVSGELLSGYLDGELDEKQKKELEEHLKTCQICRDELEELKKVDEYIRSLEVEEPSREFIFNLNHRIIARVKKKSWFPFFRFSPILVPATVAILVLIILVNIQQPSRLAGLDDRIIYVETERKRAELDFAVDLETAGKVAEKRAVAAERVVAKKEKMAAPSVPPISKAKGAIIREPEEMRDEDLVRGGAGAVSGEFFSTVSMEELEIPKDRVVRAIIDTTGKVVKVATGNTIIPEKDTMLENRLQGQQLAPAVIRGRKTQLYVDLTQRKAKKD
jgi:hypothetical protein